MCVPWYAHGSYLSTFQESVLPPCFKTGLSSFCTFLYSRLLTYSLLLADSPAPTSHLATRLLGLESDNLICLLCELQELSSGGLAFPCWSISLMPVFKVNSFLWLPLPLSLSVTYDSVYEANCMPSLAKLFLTRICCVCLRSHMQRSENNRGVQALNGGWQAG